MLLLDGLRQPLDAVHNTSMVHGLRDTVRVQDHHVASSQRYAVLSDEAGDIRLESERKSQVNGVVPFQFAVLADDNHLFMLPTDSGDAVLILEQAKCQIAITIHPTCIVVHNAIEYLEE